MVKEHDQRRVTPLRREPLELSRPEASERVLHGDDSAAEAQRGDAPLIVLLHHYPLEAPQFRWTSSGLVRRIVGDVHVPMWIPERERERFWDAARAAAASLVLCGHVHRTRLDWKDGIGVGLNGQSGAEWAGRTIAYYEITPDGVRTETTTPASRSARRASAPRN